MTHNELTALVAATLLGCVLLGWFLHWIVSKFDRRGGPRSIKRTADMASRLHQAEEERHRAEARLSQVERDLNHQISELQVELNAANASLASARDQTEEIRHAYRKVKPGIDPSVP